MLVISLQEENDINIIKFKKKRLRKKEMNKNEKKKNLRRWCLQNESLLLVWCTFDDDDAGVDINWSLMGMGWCIVCKGGVLIFRLMTSCRHIALTEGKTTWWKKILLGIQEKKNPAELVSPQPVRSP